MIVVSGMLGAITLLILFSLRRNAAPGIGGIGEWVLAFLGGIVVVALLVGRGVWHPLLSHAVGNTLLVVSVLLIGRGLQRFYGAKPDVRPLALTAGVLFGVLVLLTVQDYGSRVRLTVVAAALLWAYGQALWCLHRHASGTLGERITQLGLMLPVLGIALRLLNLGQVGDVPQLFGPSLVQSLYLTAQGVGFLTAGVGFILMVNERTRVELQKLARSLEQTTHDLRQQSAAKSKFLAYAGHDIRQPLQAIHLQLAGLMASGLPSRQLETARQMELSVNALTDLLDALLDISKLEAGAVEPHRRALDLDVLLAQLVQELRPQAAARGLTLRLHLPPQEVTVWTDERLLASVLRNLIGNAIKYTREGGVLVAVRRRAAGYRLQVWDSGIGISLEHQERIFEEYYQVDNPQRDRSKGLGLGLAIVRRIAGLLDLQLRCRSRVGRGTVMELTLPAAERQPAVVTGGAGEGEELDLRGARVIVVEDAGDVAQALVQWLQALGAQVTHYRSADEALARPDTFGADLYLSDHRLPGRLTGLDFLETLRARVPGDVQAVLLTGDTSSDFIERLAASGWPVLYKPVHPRELRAVLKMVRAQAGMPA